MIGATSGSSKLVVGGSSGQTATPTAIQMDNTYGTAAFDKLKFYLFKGASESYGFGLGALAEVQYWAGSSSTGTHVWYTSQTERARIDSSGNLLIGKTATGVGTTGFAAKDYIEVTRDGNPVAYITRLNTDGDAVQFRRSSGSAVGSISVTTTATAYNTSSDQRLKENIQNADSASTLIDSLQVRKFDWKSNGSQQRYGFVAQELVAVAPEAVYQPADPDEMMAVDYSKLVPMLVKELQSLRKRLADAGIA